MTRQTSTTTHPAPQENSVLIALRELSGLESERIAREEKEAVARARAEAAARQAALEAEAKRAFEEESARALAAAQAERDVRARAQAELERDQRMAAMRAELLSIQSERGQLRAELAARSVPRPERRGYGLAFGVSSLVAATLAGALVLQAHATQPSLATTSAARTHAPSALHESAAAAAPEDLDGVSREETGSVEGSPVSEPAVATPVSPARRRHPVRPPHGEHSTERDDGDLSTSLDFDDEEGLLPSDAHRSR